ncbi:MAG TPA: tetratricopeptide repeat protein [Stellaceae bacterium]
MKDPFQRAVAYFQGRELQRAAAVCDEILAHRPDHAKALALAGVVALLQGRPTDAAERLARAAVLEPSSGDILSNLGTSYIQLKRFGEAAEIYARAVALRPDHRPLRVNLATAYKALGRYDAALAEMAPLVAAGPADVDVLVEMGNLHVLAGDAAAAIHRYRDAVAQAPTLAAARRGLAHALQLAGQPAAALEEHRRLAESRPQDAAAQIDFGMSALKAGDTETAIEALRRGVALDAENMAARAALGKLLRARVPQWHFLMLGDEARNAAYDAAIRKAVEPGALVLDIGTGSGLLAMMAARAGAGHVFACEAEPVLAAKAREIVRSNGLDHRITVIPKRSIELRVGHDLPRKVDVLISEIVDEVLLGEGIVRTLAHALTELVAEGAAVVPRAGVIHAMLVDSPTLHQRDHVRRAAGFDVSLFNEFSRFSCTAAELRRFDYRQLSAPVEAFRFDFSRPGIVPESKVIELAVSARGTGHALVTWFDLLLDDEHRVGSNPLALSSHWGQVVHVCDSPRVVEAGEVVRVVASHDTHDISFLLSHNP